jgi:TATA-box binding protein (TBP) (component of TFIID and TFIIIB)
MKVVNINYQGRITCPIEELDFSTTKTTPQMLTFKCEVDGVKLIVFRSGKCRLMGCKEPVIKPIKCQVPYRITKLMSVTLTMDIQRPVNLYKMSMELGARKCQFEPEIFPAARLIMFNPICVNVFHSGKIVVLGVRHMSYKQLCTNILNIVHSFS